MNRSPREESFEKAAFTEAERKLLSELSTDRTETLTRFWCAKEAVSKALGQGMIEGPQSVVVTEFDPASGEVIVEISERFASRLTEEVDQTPLVVETLRKEDFIVATILLGRTPACREATTRSFEKSPAS